MRYLLLLYGTEATRAQPGSPEWADGMAGYIAFAELGRDAIQGGDPLQGTAAARAIHHDGGQVRVTDGPYAETAEVLGGFYVIEAASLDDAIELARHNPRAHSGWIEIRPMVEWFDRSAELAPADGVARYLATMHGPETDADVPGTPEWEASMPAHKEFGEQAGDALYGGGAIQPAATATTIHVRDGELLVTDGPFSEVIEVVGGFYLLRGTLEQVADVASRIPVDDGGAVELRPLVELG